MNIDKLTVTLDEALAGLMDSPIMAKAAGDIIRERVRQISAEGWTPQHDDQHDDAEMALAASLYAMHAWNCQHSPEETYTGAPVPEDWPWDKSWWKPKTPRKDLIRAAALILAEIERMDREDAPTLVIGKMQ